MDESGHTLRMVSAAELHTESLLVDDTTSGEAEEGDDTDIRQREREGTPVQTNRNTIDDTSTQSMTMLEIEELKKGTTGAGKEIIAKLLESHSALDQKTEFSRAKYTLRKRKKYLRRFTALPLDTSLLMQWMLEEKDASKIMELKDESMGLIGCLANVHHGGGSVVPDSVAHRSSGRWLVVDDTPGLVVAAMAERMGILHPPETDFEDEQEQGLPENSSSENQSPEQQTHHSTPAMSATHTTLTVIHPNSQPNASYLKYFNFDVNNPTDTHPLYTHLKTLSWMQLLEPESDPIYANEPATVPDDELANWKPSKRGLYYRKRRRCARIRLVVDETRAGGFDGLIVSTQMDPVSILKHTIPLLSGSAPIVVYSPHIEPLVNLVDLYSTARKTAFLSRKREAAKQQQRREESQADKMEIDNNANGTTTENSDSAVLRDEEDFPLDPTLILAPTIHTSRARPWQVLPGRTHPLMTGRGGAEGYVFHAIRVLPVEGDVAARGVQGRKKRKAASDVATEG